MVVENRCAGEEISCAVQDLTKLDLDTKSFTEPSDLTWAEMAIWLRTGLMVAKQQKVRVFNISGEIVKDEISFRAFNTEQYWSSRHRLRFEVKIGRTKNG